MSTIQPLTLEGDDAAAFNLDADGNVSFSSNPDFENPISISGEPVYNFTIKATDVRGNFSEKQVFFNVIDQKSQMPSLLDTNDVVVDDGYTTSSTQKIGGVVAKGTSVELFIGDVKVDASISADSVTGEWSYVLDNPMSVGGGGEGAIQPYAR